MNPDAVTGPCPNKGENHIERSRSMGYKVRIGRQRCPTCGARIEVVEKRKGWAFTPPHERGSR